MRILSICPTAAVLALGVGCMDDAPPLLDSEPAKPAVGQTEQGIVGGTPTADYLAVPEISTRFTNGDAGNCSGSLISPRVVLTAAHCLDADAPIESSMVTFGPQGPGNNLDLEFIPYEDVLIHPGWNGDVGNGNDVALLLMAHDAIAEPITYNTTPLNSGHEGQTITWVGWGVTSDGGNDSGVKRIASGPVDGVYQSLVGYGDLSATTCSGDSGGPGFMNIGGQQRVVSITSFHTGFCGNEGQSYGTRTDVYSSFISSFVTQRDVPLPPEVSFDFPKDGAAVGPEARVAVIATDNTRVERVELYVNGTLDSTIPLEPFSDVLSNLPIGPVTIEARAYDNRGDMSSAQITVNVDVGGGVGVACENNGDCGTNICGELDGEKLCTSDCTDASECPDDFECRGAPAGACWPKGGGGCQTSGGSPSAGLFLLLGAALLVRRRRSAA